MRATGAYIASAGTAIVMLAASLATFALVSTLVAFGAWPGTSAGSRVDQVLVSDVGSAKPKPIPVRADAVGAAHRAQMKRQARAANARTQPTSGGTVKRSRNRTPTASGPGRSAPTGAGTPATAGAPVAATPVTSPAGSVKQGAQQVTKNLDTTTQKLAGLVTQPVQNGTEQVGGVFNQVTSPVQQTAAPPVQQ